MCAGWTEVARNLVTGRGIGVANFSDLSNASGKTNQNFAVDEA